MPQVKQYTKSKLGEGMPIEKSDLLQGTLDMLILKIVALGPVHGYGISLRIRQISKEVLQVQQGSLYPALHRLEKRRWLEAEWGESEKGRQAKFYKLSAKGRKQLESEESNWNRLAGAVANIMQTAQ
jgi:PadR family transcriptional regulator PadR